MEKVGKEKTLVRVSFLLAIALALLIALPSGAYAVEADDTSVFANSIINHTG